MDPSLVELESIIRNRVCKVCVNRTINGDCGLEKPSSCALFQFFPQVARAIQSVKRDDIQQYVDAIRREVCAVCADQDRTGRCRARLQVECALDAYLQLVVDAIEEAPGKTFDRKNILLRGRGALRARANDSYEPPNSIAKLNRR